MTMLTLSLIFASVLLSVIAQILLKFGMSSVAVQSAITSGGVNAIFAVITNLFVIFGLSAYVSSAAIWLAVLSKIDVSKAYPFVGLGFIGTMMFAHWFLNEPLTVTKVAGTLLVVSGVLLISR